jgi:glycosyltransferase involved in cell wall biosynthesis
MASPRGVLILAGAAAQAVLSGSSANSISAISIMTLLIVMPSGISRGGAEEALVQLVENRKNLPFEIAVLFLEEGDLVDRIRDAGGNCMVRDAGRLRNPMRLLGAVKAISNIIMERGFSAVVAWMTKAHIYGGLAALISRVPAIVFQHGMPDEGRVDRMARMIPSLGTLVPSEFIARMQRKVSTTAVVSVLPGMDERRFDRLRLPSTSDAKQQLGFAEDRPLVGIVGRLQKWKGMHVFLAALAEVLRSNTSVQGVIVGGIHEMEPDYPELLENEVKRLGIGGAVWLVGAQRNVQQWMQAMDIVVHASEEEPFGIVVIEAMALGKAVVASIPGGPEEILRDEEEGLLVPSGDTPALARAIVRFLDNDSLARRCGTAALERAREFTGPRFAQRFSDAVLTLLKQKVSSEPCS